MLNHLKFVRYLHNKSIEEIIEISNKLRKEAVDYERKTSPIKKHTPNCVIMGESPYITELKKCISYCEFLIMRNSTNTLRPLNIEDLSLNQEDTLEINE